MNTVTVICFGALVGVIRNLLSLFGNFTTTSSVFTLTYFAAFGGNVRNILSMFRDFTTTSTVFTVVYSAFQRLVEDLISTYPGGWEWVDVEIIRLLAELAYWN